MARAVKPAPGGIVGFLLQGDSTARGSPDAGLCVCGEHVPTTRHFARKTVMPPCVTREMAAPHTGRSTRFVCPFYSRPCRPVGTAQGWAIVGTRLVSKTVPTLAPNARQRRCSCSRFTVRRNGFAVRDKARQGWGGRDQPRSLHRPGASLVGGVSVAACSVGNNKRGNGLMRLSVGCRLALELPRNGLCGLGWSEWESGQNND